MADPTTKMASSQRLTSGEGPFSARFHNQAIDAIKDNQRRNPSVTDGEASSIVDQFVRVVNKSTEDLPQGSIVGFGEAAFDPADDEASFLDRTVLESAAPAPGADFGILIEPIPGDDDSIGRAVVVGTAQCTIDVSDASHQWAGPIAGNYTKLASQSAGPARILWKQSGTGEKWAVVLLSGNAQETQHIWANCRIDGDDVTVLFDDRIPFCTRVGAGKFVFGFDVDFVNENAFTWAGSLGNNEDYFYEVDRSPTSVTVQTASAADPADIFGIAVHGKIAEAESDSSGSDIFEPGECTLATSPARYYHTRDFAALDGDCTVCAWLANNAFNPVTGACIELANFADCFWGANLGQFNSLGLCALDVEWARAYYRVVFFRDVTDGVYKLQWIITKQYTAEQHILAQYEVDDDTWPGDIPLTLTRTTSSTDDLGACNNWPATITLSPGTCAQTEECTTTVSFADADLDIAAATVTITGTGFSTTPGDNLVTFNLGATGTVTASTSTTLTVTITTPPTTTGALTAIVTVGACSSGAAVQVATVVSTPSGCGDSGTLTDGGTTTLSETPDGTTLWSEIATTEGVGVRVEYLVVAGDGGTIGVYTGTCPSGLTLRGTLTDSGCFYVDPADTEDGFVYIAWTSADVDSVVQIRATNGVDCSGDSCENALTMVLNTTYSTPGIWYRFTPSTPGNHQITFTGAGTHTTWTGSCESLETEFTGTTAGCLTVSVSSGDLFIQVSADTPMTIIVQEGSCP